MVEHKDKELIKSLLIETRKKLLKEINRGLKFSSGTDFENKVYETLIKICNTRQITTKVEHNGPQTFPDLCIKSIGIEIKLSQRDSWESLGNSIREGTKIKGLTEIYVFFLKQDRTPDIKFGPYKDFLSDIIVTHSPRYKINMNIKPEESILKKINMDYDNFSGDSAIKKIQEYYSKQGKDAWWIISKEDKETTAFLRKQSDLSKDELDKIRVDCMIFFPEIFSKSKNKYERLPGYILENYDCIFSNLRDLFSAGGKKYLELNNGVKLISKIEYYLYELSKKIHNQFNTLNKKDLEFYWKTNITAEKNKESSWLEFLNKKSKEADLKDIYLDGLKS